MAVVSYATGDAEVVKLWSRKLFRESLKATFMRKFMGEDSNSIIQVVDDTSKGPGDRITMTLRMQLSGNGIAGDNTLEGQEEDLTTYTQNVTIDQLRHAVRSGGRMSEQRIPFSVREEARLALQDWWADRFDTWLFNQLAGDKAQTDTRFTGMQSVTAVDVGHYVSVGTISADETLSASQTMTIDLIDKCVVEAKLASPVLRPIMVGGNPHYVIFLHPDQVKDMRVSTTTGQWLDIQKAAMQGGRVGENPIFSGALGVYNGVILHESSRVPQGNNSSTNARIGGVRRAIFCGAQAAALAFGRNNGGMRMTWVEELFDFQNQLGVSAGVIAGAVRTIFNSKSFGSIVLATAATSR